MRSATVPARAGALALALVLLGAACTAGDDGTSVGADVPPTDATGPVPTAPDPIDARGPAEPTSGLDLSYEVRALQRTLVDDRRPTPALGGLPAEDERRLDTWLWVPDGEGPFPLIAFSHGLAGRPEGFGQLLSTWASHGYVVAAPAFPRTNGDLPDPTAGLPDLAEQPGDVSFVIDEVLAMAGPGGELDGLVDADRIGAGGLSLGGGTTYGLVYNSCCRDERIVAAEVLAGADFPFPGDYDLSTGPPLLVAHGTLDPAIPYDTAVRIVDAAGVPTWFVTLVDGLHSMPFDDLESPYDRDVERLTTAFWDVHLAGRADRLGDFVAAADVPGLITLRRPA